MPAHGKGGPTLVSLTSEEIRHVAGSLGDDTVAALLACEPSLAELQVAVSYARGEGSELGRSGHPLLSTVARLYDILNADDLYASGDEG